MALKLALLSLGLAVLGLLLVFEVIRPFRDMSKDGPLAMVLWGVGAATAFSCFFLRPRSTALSVIALLANSLALIGLAIVFFLLSRSTFIWH